MGERVWDALFVVLLLNILIIGLSCGGRVVVIGGGSEGSGPIPTTDLGPSSLPSPRDPSQYEPPNLPALPNSGSTNSSTSSTSTIIGTNQSVTRTLEFSMTSRVVGSSTNSPGRSEGFSEWKSLNRFDFQVIYRNVGASGKRPEEGIQYPLQLTRLRIVDGQYFFHIFPWFFCFL